MSARSVHSLKPEPHAIPHASRKELKLKGGLCISHMTVDSALGQVPGNFNPAILMVVDLAVDRNASNLPSPASQVRADCFGPSILRLLVADVLADRCCASFNSLSS
jgi:hypothetical protein